MRYRAHLRLWCCALISVAAPATRAQQPFVAVNAEERLAYRLDLTVQVREPEPGGLPNDEASTISGHAVYMWQHRRLRDQNDPLAALAGPRSGLTTFRLLSAEFDLLGLRAGTTTASGAVAMKPQRDGGLLVISGDLADQWGLTVMPMLIWPACGLRYPLAEHPLEADAEWGDTTSGRVGPFDATASVKARFDGLQERDGRPCAVFSGRFELRTRPHEPRGLPMELAVAYVGDWQTRFDPERERVVSQQGHTELVLQHVGVPRDTDPWLGTYVSDFTTTLLEDFEYPASEARPEAESRYVRGWKLLAPPFIAPTVDLEAAQEAFEDALAGDAEDPRYHESLAMVLARRPGRTGEALSAMQRAVALAPKDARVRFALAGILAQADRHRDALNAYLECARLDPNNALPLYLAAAERLPGSGPAKAAQLVRQAQKRPTCRVLLPPIPGLAGDVSRMGSALHAAGAQALVQRVSQLADELLASGTASRAEVADLGRALARTHPNSFLLAVAGVDIEERALSALDGEPPPDADERLRRVADLRARIASLEARLPPAQARTLGVLAPVASYATGAPVPMPMPLFADEEAAAADALAGAFDTP